MAEREESRQTILRVDSRFQTASLILTVKQIVILVLKATPDVFISPCTFVIADVSVYIPTHQDPADSSGGLRYDTTDNTLGCSIICMMVFQTIATAFVSQIGLLLVYYFNVKCSQ